MISLSYRNMPETDRIEEERYMRTKMRKRKR
jgi:hypothetical protein